MIDEHEWRSVLQTAQDGTISKAAKNLYVSQPSLSQCIKKIENELGMNIFERGQTPLRLTEAGRAYVEAAQRIRDIRQSLLRQVDDLSELRNGQLRIGSSRTRTACLLSEAMVAFHQRYPNIRLSIVETSTARLQEHVLQGNVDFALLYEPLDQSAFSVVPIRDEQVFLAVPAGPPLTQPYGGMQPEPYPQVSFARFADEPFIALKQGRCMASIFGRLCQQTGITPPVVFEADSILSAAELCAQGLGATLVTDMIIDHGLWHRRPFFFALEEPVEPRRLAAAYGKRQASLPRAARIFLEFLH
ncbi:MAG: LysR family transcriptional regulator [Schwartzia sp.]|nr:LysR family transcriptional regulator [Schwartzia sp. (in: firmicutes)]